MCNFWNKPQAHLYFEAFFCYNCYSTKTMQSKATNPCTRCGKERIEGKKYKEEIATFFGTSTIVHVDTVCPDKDCQEIVESKLEALRLKSEEMKQEKQKKLEVAAAARKKNALAKLKN